jgi:TonB family protein
LERRKEKQMLNGKSLVALLALSLPCSGLNAQTAPAAQLIATSTSATSDADPLALYKSYDEALNANRLTDAARFAAQAWQAAETKWGATNPNTGPLAYNAAWSAALVGRSSERIDAARRAVELARGRTEGYTLPDAQFLLAYGEYFATPEKDRVSGATKLAAAAMPVSTTWNDFLIVNALVTSANVGVGSGRGRATIEIADRALASIDRLTPEDNNSRVMALFARAKGRLLTGREREEAVADLVQARLAYGPMKVADDKTWGALAAWELAIRSVLATAQNNQASTGTRISPRTRRAIELTPEQSRIIYTNPFAPSVEKERCEGVRRIASVGTDIQYPVGAANDYKVAGVIVRADMNEDGTATNVRLLGSVPAGEFGESALRAVRTWQYAMPAGVPAACRRDRDIAVSFVIAN